MLTPEETVQALLRDVDRLILGGLKRELTTTLQEIETRLAADLAAAAAANGGTLDARFTTRRAQAFREQCRLATEYAQQRLAGVSAARSSRAVAASVAHVERVLGTFEADHRGLSMPLPILTAAQRTAANGRAEASVLRQRQSSVQRYGTAMIGDFEEGIRLGLARGKTSGEVIANLISVSPPGLAARLAATEPRSFPDPKRGFVAKQYWAERIVRTETANAQNEANQQAIVEAVAPFPDLKRKILAVGDKRTAEDSIYVHGQVRGTTEPFTDGAGRVYLRPPARPNDRETVIPWRDAWAETKTTEKHDPPTLEELAERAERMRAAEAKKDRPKAGGAVKAVDAQPKASRKPRAKKAPAAKLVPLTKGHTLDDYKKANVQARDIGEIRAIERILGTSDPEALRRITGIDTVMNAADVAALGRPRVVVSIMGSNELAVSVRGYTSSNGTIAIDRTVVRYTDPVGKEGLKVKNDYFKMPDSEQAKGTGKKILATQLAEYRRLGVKRIDLDAAWVGNYVWPKMGYTMRDPGEWGALKYSFKSWLRSRGIPDAIADHPKSVHELACLETTSGRKIGKEYLLDRENTGGMLKLTLDLGGPGGRIADEYLAAPSAPK